MWILWRGLPTLGNLFSLCLGTTNRGCYRAGLGDTYWSPARNAQIWGVQSCEEILQGRPLQAASEAQSRRNEREVDKHARECLYERRAASRTDSRPRKGQPRGHQGGKDQRGRGDSVRSENYGITWHSRVLHQSERDVDRDEVKGKDLTAVYKIPGSMFLCICYHMFCRIISYRRVTTTNQAYFRMSIRLYLLTFEGKLHLALQWRPGIIFLFDMCC